MKKLLFVLLVLLAFGLLTAVESDPSATVGYVKYPSVAGLNFAAMPMDDGMTLVSEVGMYMGPLDEIDTINLWDASGQYWNGCVNFTGGFWIPDEPVGPVLSCITAVPMPLIITASVPCLLPMPSIQ